MPKSLRGAGIELRRRQKWNRVNRPKHPGLRSIGRRKYWTASRSPWIMLCADQAGETSDHECLHDIAARTIDAVAPGDPAAREAGDGGSGSEGPWSRSSG